MNCERCHDKKWLCETHPDQPYPHCGSPGIPCDRCNASMKRPSLPPDWQPQLQDEMPVWSQSGPWNETQSGQTPTGQFEIHNDSSVFIASVLSPEGTASVYMTGKPEQHEDNSLPAATLLAASWSRTGARWVATDVPETDRKDWVDAYLTREDGLQKHVQVRRVAPRHVLRRVATNPPLKADWHINDLIDNLWFAYDSKALKAAPDVVFLLDGRQPGVYSFGEVVDAFRNKYGARLRAASQWAEVWIVGYGVDSVVRLDA